MASRLNWVELGAFAKPEQDRKHGKTLHRERVHLKDAKSTHTFTTASSSSP